MNEQSGKDNEGFAARWSRKKTEQRERQSHLEVKALDEEENSSLREQKVPDEGDEVKIDNQELPEIDNLDKDSDYTPFLKDGVPSKLKRLALRKLWMSDPAFGFIDGLDDYAEDFSAIGIVAQEVLTNYRPGKGMIDPDEPKEEVVGAEGPSDIDESSAEPKEEVVGAEGKSEIDESSAEPNKGVMEDERSVGLEEGSGEPIYRLDKDANGKEVNDGTERIFAGAGENSITSHQGARLGERGPIESGSELTGGSIFVGVVEASEESKRPNSTKVKVEE